MRTFHQVWSVSFAEKVVLWCPVPDHSLNRGDVGMPLEFVPRLVKGERGCTLEVFNATGVSIAVVTVPESWVEPLSPDAVLSMRMLEKVA